MTKIVFFFAGTNDKAENYSKSIEPPAFASDVIRIYIDGCQHPAVGGSRLTPDLNIAAQNIRSAFEEREVQQFLNIEKLKAIFGTGIFIHPASDLNSVRVETIGLEGFSRGAVTTFAVAKALNELKIPIDLIANQPVPGTEALYTAFEDLSSCYSIRSAMTFIATADLHNPSLENIFFQQMLARLPKETKAENILLPHQQHLEWQAHALMTQHRQKFFSTQGYALETEDQKKVFERYIINIISNDTALPQPMQEKILYLYAKEGKIFCSYIDSQGAKSLDIDLGISAPEPFIIPQVRKLRSSILQSLIEKATPSHLEHSLTSYYQEKKELFFTPEAFRQKLYNAHGIAVEKDPCYLQSRRQEALMLLEKNHVALNAELNDLQAQAIVALEELSPSADQVTSLYTAILSHPRFAELILGLDETLKYLAKSIEKKEGEPSHFKAEAIRREAQEYKIQVILAAKDFIEDRNIEGLNQKLTKAEQRFETKALGIERHLFSKALTIIRDLLGKLTGLALFSRPLILTESSHIMKERLQGLKDLIGKEPLPEEKQEREPYETTPPIRPSVTDL